MKQTWDIVIVGGGYRTMETEPLLLEKQHAFDPLELIIQKGGLSIAKGRKLQKGF